MNRLFEITVLLILLTNSAIGHAATPPTTCLQASTYLIDVDHASSTPVKPVIYADSPNGQQRVTLNADGTVSLTHNSGVITSPPTNSVRDRSLIHWAADSQYVAVVSNNLTEIWSANPIKMVGRIPVTRVFWSLLGHQFVYWIKDTIHWSNAETQTETTYPLPGNIILDCPECIEFKWADDGSAVTLIYTTRDNFGLAIAYQIIDLNSGHMFQDAGISLTNADGPGRKNLAEWINGKWVYLQDSSSDISIRVIDPKTGSHQIRFSGISHEIFVNPGKTIVAIPIDQSLILMNLVSGKTKSIPLKGVLLTNNPVWSPNGKYLVMLIELEGTPDQRQMIWFSAEGSVLHKASITTASLETQAGNSPGVGAIRHVDDDGTVIFAAGSEHGVQIRRIGLNTKEEILLENLDASDFQHWETEWEIYPAPKGHALALHFPSWMAGHYDLYVLPGDGKPSTYFSAQRIGGIRWSSDGSRLAFWYGNVDQEQFPPEWKNTVVAVLNTHGVQQFSQPVKMTDDDPFEWIACP